MSDFIPKPRLGYYRALLSYENPNLEKIIADFIYWSKFVEYLTFRKEDIHTYEKEYKLVKAAKRGNDVYSWRLGNRLKHLFNLPQIELRARNLCTDEGVYDPSYSIFSTNDK